MVPLVVAGSTWRSPKAMVRFRSAAAYQCLRDSIGSIASNSASASDINDALSGLSYREKGDYNGGDALSIPARDAGESSSASVANDVTPANNLPTPNPSSTLWVQEGSSGSFQPSDFELDDLDLAIGGNTLRQEVFQVKQLSQNY